MCYICEMEERVLNAVEERLDEVLNEEAKTNNQAVTPFFVAQVLTRGALQAAAQVPASIEKEDPEFTRKSEEQSVLVVTTVQDALMKLAQESPDGIMQGNVIIGLLYAAHEALSDFNKQEQLSKMMKGEGGPMGALMKLLERLGATESEDKPTKENSNPFNTAPVDNIEDKEDFPGLFGAIGDDKA